MSNYRESVDQGSGRLWVRVRGGREVEGGGTGVKGRGGKEKEGSEGRREKGRQRGHHWIGFGSLV